MKFKPVVSTALMTICLASLSTSVFSQTKPEISVRTFGGKAFRLNDLPEGGVKDRLLSLTGKSKINALKALRSRSFSELDLKSLRVEEKSGGIYFVDEIQPTTDNPFEELTQHQPMMYQLQSAAHLIDPLFDSSTAFKLHSKPGSNNVIYLDFDGHVLTNTTWNVSTGETTLNAKGYSLDNNYTSFNNDELRQIAVIWHQIAEDFAPFDVDITTEKPSNFTNTTAHVLITESVDNAGKNMPNRGYASGIAPLGAWANFDYQWGVYSDQVYVGYYRYPLIYTDATNNIAGTTSHEIGHVLGLLHDGYNGAEYYTKPGVWGPIMGATISKVGQWSNGDYAGATQTQDDIAIIASKLSYRTDDHDSTGLAATPLTVSSSGLIVATNPENDSKNTNTDNKGIIEKKGDVDYFSFKTDAGSISLAATPAWDAFYNELGESGGNVDIALTLYNDKGVKVAQVSPTGQTDAALNVSVAAGTYLLAVSATGDQTVLYSDYGSIGQYFLSGSIVKPGSKASDISATTSEDSAITIGLGSGGNGITYAIATGPAHGAATVSGNAVIYTPAQDFYGSDSFTYSKSIAGGNVSTATVSVAVTSVNDAPVASGSFKNASKFLKKFAAVASDVDGDALTYHWDFGDGYTSSEVNPKHKYNWAGVYTATLTVTDAAGASSQSGVSVYIKGCTRKIGGVATVCPVGNTTGSQTIQITLGSDDAGLTYSLKSWPKYGSVTVTGNIATFTPTPGYTGKDKFIVTVMDSRGKKPKKVAVPIGLNVIA